MAQLTVKAQTQTHNQNHICHFATLPHLKTAWNRHQAVRLLSMSGRTNSQRWFGELSSRDTRGNISPVTTKPGWLGRSFLCHPGLAIKQWIN